MHTKPIHTITWSQLNHPSFAQESALYTKQNLGRENSMLPSVTTHSPFSKSVMMLVAVSKLGVVLCRAWSERLMESICGISYYLKNMLAVIKQTVDDIIYLSV